MLLLGIHVLSSSVVAENIYLTEYMLLFCFPPFLPAPPSHDPFTFSTPNQPLLPTIQNQFSSTMTNNFDNYKVTTKTEINAVNQTLLRTERERDVALERVSTLETKLDLQRESFSSSTTILHDTKSSLNELSSQLRHVTSEKERLMGERDDLRRNLATLEKRTEEELARSQRAHSSLSESLKEERIQHRTSSEDLSKEIERMTTEHREMVRRLTTEHESSMRKSERERHESESQMGSTKSELNLMREKMERKLVHISQLEEEKRTRGEERRRMKEDAERLTTESRRCHESKVVMEKTIETIRKDRETSEQRAHQYELERVVKETKIAGA